MEMGNALAHRINANAYIECSSKENRGLRHIVEEAVWILYSATELSNSMLSMEATGKSTFNKTKDQLWSLNAAQLVGNLIYKMEKSAVLGKDFRL